MEEAYEDWQAEVSVKQTAQGILTAIETGAANTITGSTMLLGELAPDVAGALATVESAQDDYNDKYAEINDATFEDAGGATETGYRAYLRTQVENQAQMEDAE